MKIASGTWSEKETDFLTDIPLLLFLSILCYMLFINAMYDLHCGKMKLLSRKIGNTAEKETIGVV